MTGVLPLIMPIVFYNIFLGEEESKTDEEAKETEEEERVRAK